MVPTCSSFLGGHYNAAFSVVPPPPHHVSTQCTTCSMGCEGAGGGGWEMKPRSVSGSREEGLKVRTNGVRP